MQENKTLGLQEKSVRSFRSYIKRSANMSLVTFG